MPSLQSMASPTHQANTMQVNASIFKAYDIRGIVGQTLNEQVAEHLGKAFGTEDNTGWLLSSEGSETALPLGSKSLMASRILDEVRALVSDG